VIKEKTKNSVHSKAVLKAGYLAIVVNLLLAIFKIAVGTISGSLAVMSDAIHGLIDTFSGIIVVVSEKLGASKKFNRDHEKIEHIGALLIATIIIIVGVHIFIESIEKFIAPEEVEYTTPVIIVLNGSVVAKLLLGRYLKTTGTKVKSDTLIASSVETINDSIISGAVLFSALIYLIWHINLEAYISVIISIIIIKLGLELIFPKFFHHHHH
jgi:cation diffusion facilitator family transporter